MATSDRSRSAEDVPADILPIIRKSGILTDRQFEELRARVLDGDYPYEPRELTERLVREGMLTGYQVRRILNNKPYGLLVGKYVILDRIGSGSMGRVYRAKHQLMDRVVALKIIAPEIVSNSRVVSRFQREMRLVGRLDHENVVRAYDADQFGKILYIVMEYVAGYSLGQKLRTGGRMPPLAVADYGAQASRGLAHAHEQGIVHRDIKPSNLLLNEANQIKVLDLGLGVLMEADENATFATADGIAVGTIDYMSPEQACGKEVDGRSDIYSLGCSMFHLITGKLPFPGETPVDRLGRRLSGRPVPLLDLRPDVPRKLVAVLDRMMATRPEDRYQSAAELAEALQSVSQPRASEPRPVKPDSGSHAAVGMRRAPSWSAPELPTPPPPKAVTVRPSYPPWFAPLARLAERSPAGAFLALAGALAAAFAAGVAAALTLG